MDFPSREKNGKELSNTILGVPNCSILRQIDPKKREANASSLCVDKLWGE